VFFFLSHKAGRLIVPLAMIAMIIANLFLLDEPFYRSLFFLQLTFYALVILGAVVRLRPKILRLPYYFCMINSAFFAWIYHALRMAERWHGSGSRPNGRTGLDGTASRPVGYEDANRGRTPRFEFQGSEP
jgi:hypothetical protein